MMENETYTVATDNKSELSREDLINISLLQPQSAWKLLASDIS